MGDTGTKRTRTEIDLRDEPAAKAARPDPPRVCCVCKKEGDARAVTAACEHRVCPACIIAAADFFCPECGAQWATEPTLVANGSGESVVFNTIAGVRPVFAFCYNDRTGDVVTVKAHQYGLTLPSDGMHAAARAAFPLMPTSSAEVELAEVVKKLRPPQERRCAGPTARTDTSFSS